MSTTYCFEHALWTFLISILISVIAYVRKDETNLRREIFVLEERIRYVRIDGEKYNNPTHFHIYAKMERSRQKLSKRLDMLKEKLSGESGAFSSVVAKESSKESSSFKSNISSLLKRLSASAGGGSTDRNLKVLKCLLTLPFIYLSWGIPVASVVSAEEDAGWPLVSYLYAFLNVPDVGRGEVSLAAWAYICHTISDSLVRTTAKIFSNRAAVFTSPVFPK